MTIKDFHLTSPYGGSVISFDTWYRTSEEFKTQWVYWFGFSNMKFIGVYDYTLVKDL